LQSYTLLACWLIGCPFTIITDHKPLERMNLKAHPNKELGDLALELLLFDFNVIYCPGKDNGEADCLSHSPVNPPSSNLVIPEPIMPSLHFLSLSDIMEAQRNLTRSDGDIIHHSIVFPRFRNKDYIALDERSGNDLIARIHSHYGHIGPKYMLSILWSHFCFPKTTWLVFLFCKLCSVCIMNKSRRVRLRGKLGYLGPATRPYQFVSLDTIGSFSNYASSMRYVHLLVDHFSQYAWALCSSGQSARGMISLIDSICEILSFF